MVKIITLFIIFNFLPFLVLTMEGQNCIINNINRKKGKIRMNIISIGQGITLCLLPSEKFKTNYISVNFINKLSINDVALNALIPNVLKRGCEEYKDLFTINKRLDELYGATFDTLIRKKGDAQIISFSIEFLKNELAFDNDDVLNNSLDFLFKIIYKPLIKNEIFDNDFVEQEKKNLIDFINSQINDKRTYAITRCIEEMCKNEAYGINEYGKIEDVQKITPKSLFESYKKLIDNSQILIFFEGICNEQILKDKIKENTIQKRREKFVTDVLFDKKDVKYIAQELDVNQGKLTLGFRLGKIENVKDIIDYALLNTIFGGSPHSKLFENVRERLSLCYYCASRIEKHKCIMLVYSGVEDKNKDLAYNEILAQLNEIKNGNISNNEFEAAKKSLKNLYISSEDSIVLTEDFYIGQYLLNYNLSPAGTAEMIEKVTIQNIVDKANNIYLDTVYFLKGKSEENMQ